MYIKVSHGRLPASEFRLLARKEILSFSGRDNRLADPTDSVSIRLREVFGNDYNIIHYSLELTPPGLLPVEPLGVGSPDSQFSITNPSSI